MGLLFTGLTILLGLSEFAFEVGVPGGGKRFRLLLQAVLSSEEVILWASLRGYWR